MSTDSQQIETIKAQTLAIIAGITANPKPTYNVDGQSVSWNDYLQKLQATVDWCDRKLAGYAPLEINTQGYT